MENRSREKSAERETLGREDVERLRFGEGEPEPDFSSRDLARGKGGGGGEEPPVDIGVLGGGAYCRGTAEPQKMKEEISGVG